MFGVEFSRNQRFALCALMGLMVMGLSYGRLRESMAPSSGDIVIREPGPGASLVSGSDSLPSGRGDAVPPKVFFQVAGCVKKPGVYELPQGERVIDAISAAGGAKENADLQAINLAAKIEDGSRIYVPSVEEARTVAVRGAVFTEPPPGGGSERRSRGGSSGVAKLRTPGEGQVHINSADAAELQRLPGVGPATAEKILQYRAQIGRFNAPAQLMDVKGIGPKTFEKMRPFVDL